MEQILKGERAKGWGAERFKGAWIPESRRKKKDGRDKEHARQRFRFRSHSAGVQLCQQSYRESDSSGQPLMYGHVSDSDHLPTKAPEQCCFLRPRAGIV